jgi:beta-fructofuranosidase
VFWQTGEFDRKELIFHPEKKGYLGTGTFYAAKSQLDASGRRILWGWIPETRPEAEFSAAGWAGCMSLPRVLSLDADKGLAMEFLPELAQLYSGDFSVAAPSAGSAALRRDALKNFALREPCAMCELEVRGKAVDLSFMTGTELWVSLSFEQGRSGQELRIGSQTASVPAAAIHRIKLSIDASVVECVVDDKIALTTRTYTVAKEPLRVAVRDNDLDGLASLKLFTMKPISKDRLTS